MTVKPSLAVGIDLGATKIAGALVTDQGHILATEQRPTQPADGPAAVLDQLAAVIEALIGPAPAGVAGVGIGSPGRVDPVAGVVRNAVNLGWQEVALVAELQRRLAQPPPILVHKDANAEVLGELYFGAGQGCRDLVYVGIGTGLGGGAIIDGRLLIGDNLTASEIGHLSLDPAGRLCTCGLHGCAETVVSGTGALGLARQFLAEARYASSLVDSTDLTATAILEAAQQDDPLALAVLAEMAGWLGQIVAIYAIVLNPARLVIGGGFGRAAFALLRPAVQAELAQRALGLSHERLQLVPSQLASSAVGAACLVWHYHRQPPAPAPGQLIERRPE